MALRETLSPPLVVDPTIPHTHTVIFLHRFPKDTTDADLLDPTDNRLLAHKRTKNHKTLREQFPSIRWVFPHAKAHHNHQHARPWDDLSPDDLTSALGPTANPDLPYITQVVLQEAQRTGRGGGTNSIVLGGQGEAAEAAHEALAEISTAGEVDYCMTLAGFVGMHAEDGRVTRDVRAYGLASMTHGAAGGGRGRGRGRTTDGVAGTPHVFIHGGYKLQTATWDGRRIDDFADFLTSVPVRRVVEEEEDEKGGVAGGAGGRELLTPRDRPEQDKSQSNTASVRDELGEKQKYALELVTQKAAAEDHRQRILVRIEADKVERKIKQERERRARLYRAQAQRQQARPELQGAGVFRLGETPRPGSSGLEDMDSFKAGFRDEERQMEEDTGASSVGTEWSDFPSQPNSRRTRRVQGRQVGQNECWAPRSQARGCMTDAQEKALGVSGGGSGRGSENGSDGFRAGQ